MAAMNVPLTGTKIIMMLVAKMMMRLIHFAMAAAMMVLMMLKTAIQMLPLLGMLYPAPFEVLQSIVDFEVALPSPIL